MKDALNEELKAQYSARVPSQRIEREVQNFIRSAGLTERNLNRLERRMEKQAAKPDDDNMSTVTGVSAYSMRSTVSGVSKYSENQAAEDKGDVSPGATIKKGPPAQHGGEGLPKDEVKGGLGVSGMKLAPITENLTPSEMDAESACDEVPWADLDKYAALLHERDAMQRKEQIFKMQGELRKDLDQQVSDSRQRKQKEKESDLSYFHSQLGEIEKWKEHEKNRIIDQKVKHQKEKEDRDEQLRYSNSLKEAEASKRLEEDRALLNKIAQELDSEKKLYDTRRKHHKEAMNKVWSQTQQEVDEKKKKFVEQQAEDTKQMNDYIAMLEQQEKKKIDDSKSRLDAHASFLDTIRAAGLEEEKERELSETARVASEQIAANQKASSMERKKRDDLKAMRLQNQSYLFGQMKEKEDSKQKEQDEKLMQAQYLASDTAHFHSSEQQKLADKRARNLEHRRELENQIIANMKPYPGLAVSKRSTVTGTEANMSVCEVKMNKRLVAEVKTAMAQ